MSSQIKFYSSKAEWGALSNFSRHAVMIDGRSWPTTEHYYQAMKTTDFQTQEEVRAKDRPMEAKEAGQLVSLRTDWEQVKDMFMMIALLHKAIQYPEITELLVSTGSATLIEDSPTDYYWGCGADGTGKNRLGQLWMAVRDILKGEGS